MIAAAIPLDEQERLAALADLGVLDSEPDEQFDALVRAASIVCETPISLVTLVEAERQWFKANLGLPGVSETPRDVAFCAHAILGDELFEVPDATLDGRFAHNPLVEGDPNIRFYAGMPLVSGGHRLGTLCVIDRKPRSLGDAQREVLRCLATAASRALDQRKLLKLQQMKDRLAGAPETGSDPLAFIRSAWFVNAIANATSDLIAYWDADLCCQFANKAYADWFGISSDVVLGMHLRAVIGERLFILNEQRIADVLAGHEQQFENSLVRVNGVTGHVLVKYIPHVDSRGSIAGFYVSVIDVTSLKQTALQLDATEARFATLSECSPHGVFHADAQGACSYTNQRWQEIFGLSAAACFGHGWEQAIHGDDRSAVRQRWLDAGLRPDEFELDFRVILPDGRVRRVRMRARPVVHPGNKVVDFVGSAEDVTEREAALTKLAESEARFRLLADASSDMIQRLSLDGVQHYASPAVRQIFGLDPDAVIGTHSAEMIHADDRQRIGRLLATVAGGGCDHARCIHRARHKDGHWLWVEAQFSLVRDKVTGAPSEIVSTVRDVTERETLQHDLRLANHNLRLAEEIAHVGHWHVDLVRNTLAWSDEIYRIHGFDPHVFHPTVASAIDTYHPDDRAEVTRCVTEAIEARKNFDFQLRVVRPDGEIRHVVSRGLCEVDAATGVLTAIFGVLLDVTEMAEAERESLEKSSLLQAALDNMDQALVKIAADGTIELANRRFADLLALPASLLDGPRPNFEHVVDHLLKSGELEGTDAVFQRDLGERGPRLTLGTYERNRLNGTVLEVRTVPVSDGAVVRTYADITARRHAENALRESESRYRLLADATSDVITQLDLDLVQRYASPACRAILGYEPEEMVGVALPNLVHREDAERVRDVVRRLASGATPGDKASITHRMRHKVGPWIWLEANINLERDPATGAPRSLICSLRDVTERQRAARELERARLATEQAATAKAEFLANMSHELRTPLTGMLGVHDLLRMAPDLGKDQRRLITLASEAGRSLLAIVNDILDFSKIEAGQLGIECVPFGIRPLLENCRMLIGEGMASKGIAFDLQVPHDMPERLTGDPTRLRQVLLNLLTNAVKFTERGRITVRAIFDDRMERLRIEVTDTGIGIPADKLPMLFGRFTQADASTTRRYGGTGLGLAISKRLMELMSGRIGVESVLGVGTTFWFELPLTLAAVEAQEEPVVIRVPPKGRRVLLAEDNVMNREIIAAMLSHHGYEITTVADGVAAVEAVRGSEAFDLILMDLQMPVMDGLTATTAIRTLHQGRRTRPIPIIGLTANAMSEDIDRCLASGMDAHVAKPIHWPDLFGAMEKLCKIAAPPSAHPKGEDDQDVLDEATLNELVHIIGKSRLAHLLRLFEQELQRRMGDLEVEDPATLAAQVHSLAGLSGQLGFGALSRLCTVVETEARRNSGPDRLAELREAASRAADAVRACRFLEAAE